MWTIYDDSNTLVVPGMRTRCDEKALTRLGTINSELSTKIKQLVLTAIGPRQIEQSCDEPLAGGFPKAFSSRKRLWDCTLQESANSPRKRTGYTLEAAWAILPAFIKLNPYFHASEDHLLPSLEINSQLHNISIIHWKWPRLGPGRAEPYMIEKRPGRALHVFDKPPSSSTPEFAMPSAHYFRFESHWRRRRHIRSLGWLVISFRIPTNFYNFFPSWQYPSHWTENQRRPLSSWILVCGESNRR